MSTKYIFIVGGVMSSVGKGVAAASIGAILKGKGLKVTAIKADPYINVDAGTMNPTEHGEVFVTKDGDETDQDIGNYERFLNQDITYDNYMTTGRVYQTVIEKERNLEYDGKCVEVIPHIPEEIIRRIKKAGVKDKAKFVIIEIGGTIGEYQNMLFLEAARTMKRKNPKDVIVILVSYLPVPSHVGEMKTKPTQNASRELNSAGIQADFILCRGPEPIDKKRREKLATFCNIDQENAISAPDVISIYDIPVNFEKENLGNKILKKLNVKARPNGLKVWKDLTKKIHAKKPKVRIGIVGKYFATGDYVLADSYISIIEAIKHATWANGLQPEIGWINSEVFEKDKGKLKELKSYHGIIVPGGFGSRGIEGKILTAKYCRENNIPYFGLCYGMQIATIEFARNVCGLKKAHTTEIDPKTKYPVIDIMEDQKKKMAKHDYGGSMRLGHYECKLKKNTISYSAYGKDKILERHRHRYEFNNKYRKLLESKGLVVAGINTKQDLVEIIEIKGHPFMVGTQFHPELQSRPLAPHPLFVEFIKIANK